MSTNYGSVDVKCPFYQRENGRTIACEGIKGVHQMIMTFGTRQEKANWKEAHCNRLCSDCQIRKLVEKKY